jgi:hypothetical protein
MPRRQINYYEMIKTEAISFRTILIRNIVISVCSAVVIMLMLPILARYVYVELWAYSYDNIEIDYQNIWNAIVEQIPVTDTGDVSDLGDLIGGAIQSVITAIVWAVVSQITFTLLVQISWGLTFVGRVIRFTYLSVLLTMAIFLAFFWILSLIMMNKIKMKVTLFSIVISGIISFGVTYFLIPANNEIMNIFIDLTLGAIQNPEEVLTDIPTLALDIIYAFYQGFLWLGGINLVLVTLVQTTMRKW